MLTMRRLYPHCASISDNRREETEDTQRDALAYINENKYYLYETNGGKPQILIFGFAHHQTEIDQEEELSKILTKILKNNDYLALEGANPSEISPEDYSKIKILRRISKQLTISNATVVFHDKLPLVSKSLIYEQQLKKNLKKGDELKSKEFEKKLIGIIEERDRNFVFNPAMGLIPLLRCEAKRINKTDPPTRIISLLGMGHIIAGTITKALEQEGVNYRAYLPEFNFK